MNSKALHMVAFILLVVGGLNWLLTAFDFNLVSKIFGAVPVVERAIYVLVGLAAIYEVVTFKSREGGAPSTGTNPSGL